MVQGCSHTRRVEVVSKALDGKKRDLLTRKACGILSQLAKRYFTEQEEIFAVWHVCNLTRWEE